MSRFSKGSMHTVGSSLSDIPPIPTNRPSRERTDSAIPSRLAESTTSEDIITVVAPSPQDERPTEGQSLELMSPHHDAQLRRRADTDTQIELMSRPRNIGVDQSEKELPGYVPPTRIATTDVGAAISTRELAVWRSTSAPYVLSACTRR